MFHSFVLPCRCPFARPALPGFIAPIGTSDFRLLILPRSLFRLAQDLAPSLALTDGSPEFLALLLLELDTAYDPGADTRAHLLARVAVAYW